MQFQCSTCGRKLTVDDSQAGRKGRCPQCKELVTVPKVSPRAIELLDLTGPAAPAPPTGTDHTDVAYAQLSSAFGGRLAKPEEIPERKRPWFIDIFLYPLNRAGLMTLLGCVGVPLLLQATTKFFGILTMAFAPAMVFWVLLLVLFWGAVGGCLLYMNWYVGECIRDSARGQIRAADTIGETPGLIELFGQALYVAASVLATFGPAIIYYAETRRADAILWVLCGAAGFVLPMALLGVAMHEDVRGLNPIRLIGSTLKTLPQYTIRAPFCYLLCALIPAAIYYILKFWIAGHALMLAAYYVWLVLAHQLGRFFYKNDETLNWDV